MAKNATTMTLEDTTRAVAGIMYTTVVTNEVAERDKDNNLTMKFRLDHQKREAIFTCREREQAGGHQHRKVHFIAPEHCILHFDNPDVFGTDKKELFKGKTPLSVTEGNNPRQTRYQVEARTGEATHSTAETAAGIRPFAPPVIVVP
jgi:hypothetical protein